MYLRSIGTAVPPRRYSQRELWNIFRESSAPSRMKDRSSQIMDRVLNGNNGIDFRHLAVDPIKDVFQLSASDLNHAFEIHAPAMAADSLKSAIRQSGISAKELDALFVCTCTGYLCPGISSYVAELLDLSSEVYLQDLVGMGCGAAIPTLRAAEGFLAAHPDSRVAVIAVEVCSCAFFLNNDPGVLISACLFGDGAASLILDNLDGPGLCFSSFKSMHIPEARELLRFENHEGRLCNKLHRSVPEVAADAVQNLYSSIFDPSRSLRPLVHPGGRDVLLAIEKKFPEASLEASYWVLRNGGNLSSPSILFVLGGALKNTKWGPLVSLPDSWSHDLPTLSGDDPFEFWLTSFGAGFSVHGCRLVASDAYCE